MISKGGFTMSKTTNRTDRKIAISMSIYFVTFWLQIVYAIIEINNYVSLWNFFIYMIAVIVLFLNVINVDEKFGWLKLIAASLLMLMILIGICAGIFVLKRIL